MVDKPKKKIKCLWTLGYSPEAIWNTDCKNSWDDENTGQSFRFCPFCGKRILWVTPKS